MYSFGLLLYFSLVAFIVAKLSTLLQFNMDIGVDLAVGNNTTAIEIGMPEGMNNRCSWL